MAQNYMVANGAMDVVSKTIADSITNVAMMLAAMPLALVAFVRRELAVNKAIKDLSELSDRQLHDIGLHRGDLESVVREL